MNARTLEFWQKYKKAPEVLAVMPAKVVGKSVSAHPGQPVQVTLETTLPDGSSVNLPLVFPGEADAEHIPDTVTIEEGTGERTYAAPLEVYVLVVSRPSDADLKELASDNEEGENPSTSTPAPTPTPTPAPAPESPKAEEASTNSVPSQPSGDTGTTSAG